MQFFIDNIGLVIILVLSAALLLWPSLRKIFVNFPEIDTLEATRLINNDKVFLLDVREPSEYASGHLDRAINIPSGKAVQRLDELTAFKDRNIIVYCRSGARSTSVCVILAKNGFEKIHNLKGGILAWEAAKLPVVK